MRAMEKVSLQQKHDDLDAEDLAMLDMISPPKRRRSRRTSGVTASSEDDDDDDEKPLGTDVYNQSPGDSVLSIGKSKRGVDIEVVADDGAMSEELQSASGSDKVNAHGSQDRKLASDEDIDSSQGSEGDGVEDDDDDEDFVQTKSKRPSVRVRLPLAAGRRSFMTKSGRVTKPPKLLSPSATPPMRRKREKQAEAPLTRSERYKRRQKGGAPFTLDNASPGPHKAEKGPATRLTRRIVTSYENDDDGDEEEELIMKGNGNAIIDAPQNGTHRQQRRVVRTSEIESRRETRNSLKRKSSNGGDDQQYSRRTRVRRGKNGVTRRRSLRNGVQYSRTSEGEDDEEGDNDQDFPPPGSEEESEEQEEPGFEDEILAGGAKQAPSEEGEEDIEVQTRRRSSRRTRKAEPRRRIVPKRKRPRRQNRELNTIARETRKSFRPRRESLRPSDFYRDDGGTSDESDVSSDDAGPAMGRNCPTRAAASRAEDAIAAEITKVDFLQNPMAIIDGGKSSKPKRGDRYSRRRNRFRPSRPDPFNSDDDDAIAPGTNAAPIEPIQVDLNLSWEDVGGLDHHVRALKEMVFLPLMYPEVFEKFHMEAPKGVLFYGPPGTGKTLCARALAASCGGDPDSSPDPNTGVKKAAFTGNKSASPEVVVPPSQGDASAPNGEQKGTADVEMTDITPKDNVVLQPMQGAEAGQLQSDSKMEAAASDHVQQAGDVIQDVTVRDEGVQDGTVQDGALQNGAVQNGPVQNEAVGNVNVVSEAKAIERVTREGQSAANPKSRTEAPQLESVEKPIKKKTRVAFFMRNGADCLSKWVGEAERQLRMTFEAAKRHQPSIIFFDEIDGLAPVRSSRQDQIHSSIVSTLLGLMDGLDSRGKIVVIGATNRVDAIDPALRRPGRFDRELIFTLPNLTARRKILGIHTEKWKPQPKSEVLDAVAKATVGYCGADLKSLCSESAICALRRRYPQIYESNDKLLIDVDEVQVATKDFMSAMREIVPASHRSARTYARPISDRLAPVLSHPLQSCVFTLKRIFPQGLGPGAFQSLQLPGSSGSIGLTDNEDIVSSEEDGEENLSLDAMQQEISNAGKLRSSSITSSFAKRDVLRPRLLICGVPGLGQAQIGPALLHYCEGCPVHAIDYPSLHADAGSRSPEEALISAFREAARSVPSILYLPHLQLWWESAPESLRTTFVIALKDLPSDLPLLVLATAEKTEHDLPAEVVELFGELLELSAPSEEQRKELFAPIIGRAISKPKLGDLASKQRRRNRRFEVLPKAPPPPPKPVSTEENAQKMQAEDRYIRLLRMEMRAFVESLIRDTRFKAFWNPVDPTSAPDYYDIIKIPMDISKIAAQVDMGRYPTVLAMVNDFGIMVKNAIQYNPPNTETGAAILRRAHGLIDIVHAWVDNLNPSLVETCNKIITERISRAQREAAEKEVAVNSEKMPGEEGQVCGENPVREPEPRVVSASNNVEAASAAIATAIAESANAANAESVISPVGPGNWNQNPPRGVEIQDVVPSEKFVEASPSQVAALQKVLTDVSTGLTVDGMEGLFVRCSEVLHERKRSMDREAVVSAVINTVKIARRDPALVGRLVE